jgi:autotransporter passenger strand-loop-strand repeat protein
VVSAGGTDLGARISGGEQDDYGLASGATVFTGGTQVVESGGVASGTTVDSGARWSSTPAAVPAQ